jgi:hypothetical protein
MSKAATNKALHLIALLIAVVTLLVSGCLPSTPGARTPEATPKPTAIATVKWVECGLELCIPQLYVELRPTPKEYTIVAEWGYSERVHCIDGKTADATKVSNPAQCDNRGATFHWAPNRVTLTVTWDGNEFSQTVTPDFNLVFPNGPECKGQRCSAHVVLELPQGPEVH